MRISNKNFKFKKNKSIKNIEDYFIKSFYKEKNENEEIININELTESNEFKYLPNHILEKIFIFLNKPEILDKRLISKKFNEMIIERNFFKRIQEVHYENNNMNESLIGSIFNKYIIKNRIS